MSGFFSGASRWWTLKFLLSVLLLALFFLRLLDYSPSLSMLLLGQVLVIIGAAINLWHYLIFKKRNPALGAPSTLVTTGGLLPWIRHPMYLGDIILAVGILFIGGLWLPLTAVALVYLIVIEIVAREEDLAMRNRFGDVYTEWEKRSRRIFF